MKNLSMFENTKVQIITDENGEPLFELYSTGAALGYVKSNGKNKGVQCVHPEAKSIFPFKSRIDIVTQNAEIKPIVYNGQLFINESQLYDFMLEARTNKCRAFRKWVTTEVLPSIRKTGRYDKTSAEPKKALPSKAEYVYFEKTYRGEPVLTVLDIGNMINIDSSSINIYLKRKAVIGTDYYHLVGNELAEFKKQNPRIIRTINWLNVITKSGFTKICKSYGIKVEEPKCFESKEKTIDRTIVKKLMSIAKENNIDIRQTPKRCNGIARKVDNEKFIIIDQNANVVEKEFEIAYGLAQHLLGGSIEVRDEYSEFEARMFAVVCSALSAMRHTTD